MGDTTDHTTTPGHSATTAQVATFIARWQGVQLTSASELSSSQTFLLDMCALLQMPTPLPAAEAATGHIPWMRPEFQDPQAAGVAGKTPAVSANRVHTLWHSSC